MELSVKDKREKSMIDLLEISRGEVGRWGRHYRVKTERTSSEDLLVRLPLGISGDPG